MDTARASNRRRATAVCAVVLASWMVAACTDDTAWLESRAGHDPAPPAQVEGAVEEADAAPDLPEVPAEPADDQPDEPAAPAPFQDAAAALGSYVAAVTSGDIDTALALRCADAQPSAEDLELFALQAGQLVGELGPLEVEFVEAAQTQGVDVVRFTLRGHDGWLEVHATTAGSRCTPRRRRTVACSSAGSARPRRTWSKVRSWRHPIWERPQPRPRP